MLASAKYLLAALCSPKAVVLKKKLLRFLTVGFASMIVYSVSVLVLIRFFGMVAEMASLTGYAVAIPMSFIGHRHITFRSDGHVSGEFLRFIVVHLAGMLCSYYSMIFATETLRMSYWIGMLLCIGGVTVINFIIMNGWVFVSGKRQADEQQSTGR